MVVDDDRYEPSLIDSINWRYLSAFGCCSGSTVPNTSIVAFPVSGQLQIRDKISQLTLRIHCIDHLLTTQLRKRMNTIVNNFNFQIKRSVFRLENEGVVYVEGFQDFYTDHQFCDPKAYVILYPHTTNLDERC